MSKLIDITGQRYGFWVAKKRGPNNKKGQVQWLCECECGKEKLVTSNSLRTGNSTSCGCNHTPDLTGKVFGKITVIKLKEQNKDKSRRYWECKCYCNNDMSVSTYCLRNDLISSCGHCNNDVNIETYKEEIERLNNILLNVIRDSC